MLCGNFILHEAIMDIFVFICGVALHITICQIKSLPKKYLSRQAKGARCKASSLRLLSFADLPRRYADNRRTIRHIRCDDGAGANYRISANDDAGKESGVGSNAGSFFNIWAF